MKTYVIEKYSTILSESNVVHPYCSPQMNLYTLGVGFSFANPHTVI